VNAIPTQYSVGVKTPTAFGIIRDAWLPPNGVAFSCRERAADHLQKSQDLAREAVNCNAVFGRVRAIVSVRRAASVAMRDSRELQPADSPAMPVRNDVGAGCDLNRKSPVVARDHLL